MCYQMGYAGFLKFTNTRLYLRNHQYRMASFEMLDSAWAKQTPFRARRLSDAMFALEDTP
jgi:lysozyme